MTKLKKVQQEKITTTKRFPVFTEDQLMALPPPEWLVDDVLGRETQAFLFGPPGEGKSFVALDVALSVASGREWHGHEVRKGRVLYVVAEGGRGIQERVKAWKQRHNIEKVEKAFYMLEAPNLHKEKDCKDFFNDIDELLPLNFIILDTFARTFVGGDENSAQDVGEWVAAATTLQQKARATVLAVHHSGKEQKKGARGSSALNGAADTMIAVKKDKDTVTLTCDKQKDAKEFDDIKLTLLSVDLDTDGSSSCVLVSAGLSSECISSQPTPNASQMKALKILAGHTDPVVSSTEWRLATHAKEKTFDNWRGWLVENGFVEAVPDKRHHYRLTQKGNAIAAPLLKGKFGSNDQSVNAAKASPPIRGGIAAEAAQKTTSEYEEDMAEFELDLADFEAGVDVWRHDWIFESQEEGGRDMEWS